MRSESPGLKVTLMCVTHALAVRLTFYIADPVSAFVRRRPFCSRSFLWLPFARSVPQCCNTPPPLPAEFTCPSVHKMTPTTVYTVNIAETSGIQLGFMHLVVAKSHF